MELEGASPQQGLDTVSGVQHCVEPHDGYLVQLGAANAQAESNQPADSSSPVHPCSLTVAATADAGHEVLAQPPEAQQDDSLTEQQQQVAPTQQEQHEAGAPGAPDPKRQICFDFTKNQCSRGAACKFSHNVDLIIRVNSQEKGICFDFLKGLCTRGLLCRFSHDLRNLQTQQITSMSAKKRFAPICYDFVKNQCTRGEDCKYSHDYSSILFGPRAPGKDPYVICVDFTRGKCSRGSSCRYSHVDPRLLANPLAAAPAAINPALLAAGLGTASFHGSSNPMAVPGLPGLGVVQHADLQAQAALLLSGMQSHPTPSMGGMESIPSWPGSMPQGTDAYAVLLDQLQRASLADTLTPQLAQPAASDASSIAALSALLTGSMAGHMSPTYAAGAAPSGIPNLASYLQQQSTPIAAEGLYSQVSAASTVAAAGSLSAAPTPTAAAAAAPTPFQQDTLSAQAPGPIAVKAPGVPMFPGLVGKGTTSDLLGGPRDTDSPTIAASWGAQGAQRQLHDAVMQQSIRAQHRQHAAGRMAAGGIPDDHAGSSSQLSSLLAGQFNSYSTLKSIWSGQQ